MAANQTHVVQVLPLKPGCCFRSSESHRATPSTSRGARGVHGELLTLHRAGLRVSTPGKPSTGALHCFPAPVFLGLPSRLASFPSQTQPVPLHPRTGKDRVKTMPLPSHQGKDQLLPSFGKGRLPAPVSDVLQAIIYPCHRILASGVSLGSLAGDTCPGHAVLHWHRVGHFRHQTRLGSREVFPFQHMDKLEESDLQHMDSRDAVDI